MSETRPNGSGPVRRQGIDPSGQLQVSFGDTTSRMCRQPEGDTVPTNIDIGVVIHLLRQGTDSVHVGESIGEGTTGVHLDQFCAFSRPLIPCARAVSTEAKSRTSMVLRLSSHVAGTHRYVPSRVDHVLRPDRPVEFLAGQISSATHASRNVVPSAWAFLATSAALSYRSTGSGP